MTIELDYSRYYNRYHTNTPEHREWMVTFYKELFSSYLPKKDRIHALDVGKTQDLSDARAKGATLLKAIWRVSKENHRPRGFLKR